MPSARNAILCSLLLMAIGVGGYALRRNPKRTAEDPATGRLVLWSWQRQDNLAAIDPRKTAVAALAATISINNGKIDIAPRHNRLTVPRGTRVIRVIRLEIPAGRIADASEADEVIETIAGYIVGTARANGWQAVQIDFDAAASQRDFYRRLLTEIHRQLPETELSIAALASWCADDPWIDDLPIAYAVPMVYRLQYERAAVKKYFLQRGGWRASKCRNRIGFDSEDVFCKKLPSYDVFIFANKQLTPQRIKNLEDMSEGEHHD